MEKEFTAVCDRKENKIAVLISDADGTEYAVREPLSLCITEGEVYLCKMKDKKITEIYHKTKEEAERKRASLKFFSRLTNKNNS